MVRKADTTDEQAKASRDAQARAAIKKLNRRIAVAPEGPYKAFLLGCRDDASRSLAGVPARQPE